MTSERTAAPLATFESNADTIRRALTALGSTGPGISPWYDRGNWAVTALVEEIERLQALVVERHAFGYMDGLMAGDPCPVCERNGFAVAQRREEEYREGMVTVRGHDQAHLGCMGTETWKWLLDHPEMDAPALDLLVAQHRDTQEALEWALDVLEVSLKRIDTIDGAVLDDEHYRIRAAGLAKARAVLDDAALASVRARTPA